MATGKYRPVFKSAFFLIAVLTVLVFLIELIIMFSMDKLISVSNFGESILDPIFLSILIFPFFYFMVYKPFKKKIIEQERIKEELQKNLKELTDFKYALDESSIVAITDSKGIINYVNDNFCKITKYSRSELIGQDHRLLSAGHHTKDFFRNLWETVESGKIWKGEIKNKAKDGTFFWLNTAIIPFLNDQGKPFQYLTIRTDITLRKEAEMALVKLNDELEQKVIKRTEALQKSELHYRSLFENMIEGFAYCKMLYKDGKPEDFIYIDVNQAFGKLTGLKNVIGKKVTEVIPKIKEDNPELFETYSRVALTGKPERFEIHLVSIDMWFSISVYSNEKEYFIAVFDVITERKKAEQAIIESKERLRDLVDNISDLICTHDLDGKVLSMNSAAEKLTGFKFDPQKIMNIKDLLASNEKNEFDNYMTGIKKNGFGHGLMKIKTHSGEIRIWEYSNSLKTNGESTAIVRGYARDITEQKKAEKEMKKSEEKYRQLFHNSPLPMWVTEIKTKRLIDVNETAIRQYGYSREEFLQMDVWKLRPGTDVDDFNKWLDKHYDDPAVQTGVWQHIRKDKSIIDVEVSSHRIIYENKPCRLIVANDITEREKTEIAMKEALKRYDTLAEATSDTIWDWNITKNKMHYNYGITKTFGYNINEVENVPDWQKKNIHPEDISYINELLDETFKKKKRTIQLNYRYRCADNSYKYILDRATVIYDEKENPLRMIGAMQDVTNEKEQEFRIGKAIVDAQEQERHQMGMELHDNVNQILSASLLYLGMTKDKKKSRDFVLQTVEQCSQYIKNAITEIRKLSHQLAPASFENVSLKEVFESLIATVNANNRFEVHLHFDEFEKNKIRSDIQTNLYRILQEQMNNIIKYSQATKVEVELTLSDTIAKLKIADNGIGFDPALVKKGIGLENIRRRTKLFSGKFKLSSSPGNGCKIIIEIPY